MWGCGLKLTPNLHGLRLAKVAPHVGAWIETAYNHNNGEHNPVAPCVGAWIETHWAREHHKPRYILDLLLSVINVSVQTVDIVNSLPRLKFD